MGTCGIVFCGLFIAVTSQRIVPLADAPTFPYEAGASTEKSHTCSLYYSTLNPLTYFYSRSLYLVQNAARCLPLLWRTS